MFDLTIPSPHAMLPSEVGLSTSEKRHDMATLATVAPFGFADFNPPTLLPLYRSLGCRRSQFYRCPSNPPVWSQAKRICADAGLPIDSMHGLFGVGYDPSSPDESQRQQAMETYRREADISQQLGGPMVVVHPAPPMDRKEPVTAQERAARVNPMQKSLAELATIGEQMQVTFLIENIPANYFFGHDPAQLAKMIHSLNHPRIRMCFDTGHAHLTTDVVQALEDCRQVTAYLHVHDNDAVTDCHLVPGLGNLNWQALARGIGSLDQEMSAMLELFESEASLRKHIEAGLAERLGPWLVGG